jgi:hypothetical protein
MCVLFDMGISWRKMPWLQCTHHPLADGAAPLLHGVTWFVCWLVGWLFGVMS